MATKVDASSGGPRNVPFASGNWKEDDMTGRIAYACISFNCRVRQAPESIISQANLRLEHWPVPQERGNEYLRLGIFIQAPTPSEDLGSTERVTLFLSLNS
ncbi:hypothetical protein ACJZ2D_009032 [Fusarium nematophilum]